jgi:hypothetical protein
VRVLLIFGLLFCGFALNSQNLQFTKMPAKKTGITFSNLLNETTTESSLLFDNFYSGGGVAIGDVNNDRMPDIFFAGNQVGDRLYINKGDFKFEDQTEKLGIQDNKRWSTGVVMADVNGDGWLDIYVCKALYEDDATKRANEFYLNNGDGTFSEQAEKWGVASTQRSQTATFFDYDNDGDLDLFVVNQPPNPGVFSPMKPYDWRSEKYSCQLFKNMGDLFVETTILAGVSAKGYGLSVSAADFNNDGWTDLYVSNDYNSPDFLYINQKDGTFKNTLHQSTGHTSFFSMGTDVADINGDGWQDLAVVDMVAEDNYRLKANMGGMEPDAFWATVREGGHYQYMFNTLQLNRGVDRKGTVHFSDIAQMAGVAYSDWSWTPLFADFDNDGDRDLFVTNGLVRDLRNTDAIKNLETYYEAAVQKFQTDHPNKKDVDLWEVIDFQVALEIFPSQPLTNYFFESKGLDALKFESKANEVGLGEEGFSTGAAYADLDLDGDLDIVVNNMNGESWVYRNDSKGNFLVVEVKDGKQKTPYGTKVEITQNGKTQYAELTNARGFYSCSEPTLHFGLTSNAPIEKIVVKWQDGSKLETKSIQANSWFTVDKQAIKTQKWTAEASKGFIKNYTADYLPKWKHTENKFDDYTREVLLPHKMSQIGPALAIGDVNGDKLEDIFVGGAKGFPATMMLQGKDGKFSISSSGIFIGDAAYEDVGAVLFDADNDGDNDLYIVSGGNEAIAGDATFQDRLYLNNNGEWIKSDALPKIIESGSVVRPFDYDSDGDLDLFVGGRQVPGMYPSPASSFILRNQFVETKTVKFENVTADVAVELTKVGMVTDAIWTDYDRDNDMDLLLIGEWMPITLFENIDGIFKKNTPIENTNGWWYSIKATDLDNDGYDDYLLGNLGLNSKYKASKHEPFSVHFDDFDENGSNDIVLSYYNFGKKYPVRGRSCSSQQIPDLKQKFPTYDLFAQADMNEVYGEDNLQKALNYDAFNFENSVLFNKKGKMQLKALPRTAQVASVNAFATLDDKIILAGNLLNTEVETPRQDGNMGLVLEIDKSGDFKTISSQASGLYLPNEVKHLAPITVAGKSMILVVRNGGWMELIGK